MKEQVKSIVYGFKDAGWTVQKIEKELKFSNGTLGKVMSGKSGISEFKFGKLMELYEKEIKSPIMPTKELVSQISENNEPEDKKNIEEERNGVLDTPVFDSVAAKLMWELEQKRVKP